MANWRRALPPFKRFGRSMVRGDKIPPPEHKYPARSFPPPPPSIIPVEILVDQDMIDRFHIDNSGRLSEQFRCNRPVGQSR
jgi:hypothetical protein